ncbi:MAG: cobalt-precorrin-5B (C(1))-methyltransferase, partial [Oscillospiraceae bacterium]|nr:cobalt-precorrin-5B (C(1))-methyltransferase [Oscillospiraceae bacterium]
MDVFRNINGKLLRCGYTTGSCAAAAAKGATEMLLGQSLVGTVSLDTPKGLPLSLMLEDCAFTASQASCAVRKDAGDDPDVTSGILVYATVRKSDANGVTIDGG